MSAQRTDAAQSYGILENVIFLKKTALFATVLTVELRAVAAIVEELVYKSGEAMVQENELGDSLYIIKDGRVAITKKVDETKTIELAELGRGDCFGEMAIFGDEVRKASAIAKVECTILRIHGDDLIDVILCYPHIGIELIKIFVGRLNRANASIERLSSKGTSGQGGGHG
jgi:CRP-like cAMP-binding protein